MRSDSVSSGQNQGTFIEQARRSQIIRAAIETLAELGYAHTSLAQIARRAGISKGVIAYHFAGKDELMSALVADVLRRADDFMRPQVTAAPTLREMLRIAIESNVAFMAENRADLVALLEITRGARKSPGGPSDLQDALSAGVIAASQLLARGQLGGEFRSDFDPQVMAMAIRAAIDSLPPRLARDPQLDLQHIGTELSRLFLFAAGAGEP
jgi:TetR/AcrR family fatty acid metabolism transcriptional regulator